MFDLDLLQRALLAGRALAFYAWKLVWPADLMFTYPRWVIDAGDGRAWIGSVAVVATVANAFVLRKQLGRGPLAALLFFAGTLFPALGFVDVFPFVYAFVADHFQYLASLGPTALLAAAATVFWRRRGLHAVAGCLVTLALIGVLGVLAWRQSHAYEDLQTLWRATLAKNPRAWMAHSNLGVELARTGRHAEAEASYRAALAIDPELHQTRFNLANALRALGRSGAAIAEYERALVTKPDAFEIHNNLAMVLGARGDVEWAAQHYRRALETAPDFASAWDNLGIALARQGQLEEAIPCFERSLAVFDANPEAHNNLGLAHGKRGDLERAVRHFQRALRLKPDYASARENLDRALAARSAPGPR